MNMMLKLKGLRVFHCHHIREFKYLYQKAELWWNRAIAYNVMFGDRSKRHYIYRGGLNRPIPTGNRVAMGQKLLTCFEMF